MRRILLAAAAVAGLSAAAAGSIVLRVTPRELADTAPLVLEGRVATVDVRWDEGRTCINTYVTFAVERAHKGRAAGNVVIKVPGGRVGDEEVRVEGTAKFAAGDEAMVFLWRDARNEWIVLGEGQGKFRLFQDAKANRRMAENSLKDLCLVMRPAGKGPPESAAKRPDLLPYDDLVAVVQASVEAERKKGTATPGGTTAATTPTAGTTDAGRDPAPTTTAPDPSASTTQASGDGAPPPSTEPPAPPAGKPVPPTPEEPKPAPPPR